MLFVVLAYNGYRSNAKSRFAGESEIGFNYVFVTDCILGFVNTEELERTIDNDLDAADQAIKEYTLEQSDPYYRVFFDPKSNVWKVVFNYFDEDAEKQAVYMSEKGKTLLIVYIK